MIIEIDRFYKETEYAGYVSFRGEISTYPIGWRPSSYFYITSTKIARHHDDNGPRLNKFSTELRGGIFWTATRYYFLKTHNMEYHSDGILTETYDD